MGALGVLAKLVAFTIILLVSYALITTVLYYGGATAGLPGESPAPTSSAAQFLGQTLAAVSFVFVGAFFTAPLVLAMFGYGGAWVKHVASRAAKPLVLALLASFGVSLVGSELTRVPSSLSSAAEDIVIMLPLALIALLVVGRGMLLASLEHLVYSLTLGMPAVADSLPSRTRDISTVELQRFPVRRIREKAGPETVKEEALRFQRLAQTLAASGGRTEFRLSFRGGRGRALLSSTGGGDGRLLSILRTHLFEYKAWVTQGGPVKEEGSCAYTIRVSGPPEPVENPLEPLAHYFLENGYEGDYHVVLAGARYSYLRRLLAARKQRELAWRSGEQKTEHAPLEPSDRSRSVRDHLAEVEHEEAVKEVERHASRLSLKVWVYVTGRGETEEEAKRVAEGAAVVVRGTLSGHRRTSALTVRRVRISRPLSARGTPTVLLPVEVVPFFWIPQMAIGSEVSPSAEFELPPEMDGEVELGTVVLQSGKSRHQARIPLDALAKHLFVSGMTGSGKTTSCFNLLMQLHRLGVPFLAIEPVKREYRSLLTSIRDLQVFTLGDEETAPFRLNIFEPPAGVKVQTHLENLEAAWNGSFVMYAPLPYVLKEVLAETYRACGWDVAKNVRGRPVSLEDFEFQAGRVTRRLGYEEKVLADIEAALKTRIRSLSLGGKGLLFNAASSIPMDAILRRPTVVELKDIPNNEEKAFVMSLLLADIVEHIETKGASRQLRHLILVEEAHRLLPNISTAKGDPESADPRRKMVEQFANMLAEVRAYGEGLVVVEQIPTKIIPDAIKNTATKVAHRVPALDDREVLAGAMNLTREQMDAFTGLQPGEAIVSLERHPLPVRVEVPDVIERVGVPLGEVGDEEVKRHMTEFYLKNPLPRAPKSHFDRSILPMVDSDWFKAKFIEAYRAWLKTGATEPLSELVLDAAKKFARDGEETFEVATKLLTLAVEFYLPFDEKDRIRFPQLFMQEVQRKVKRHP